MGGPTDMEQTECESIVHKDDCDLCVTFRSMKKKVVTSVTSHVYVLSPDPVYHWYIETLTADWDLLGNVAEITLHNRFMIIIKWDMYAIEK